MSEPSDNPTPTRQIQWSRFAVEGVVIVASILLAFGIEAWWEGMQERAEERDALVRLDAEFTAAADHLTEWRKNQLGVVEAGNVLLANTGASSPPTITPDSMGSLIWTMTFNWTADPPTGVLSSLISTGELTVIENQDLRAGLVSWEALLRDLQAGERQAEQVIDSRVIPFLETQISWRSLISALEDGAGMTPSSFPFGTEGLMANREFENIVANRATWIRYVVGEYDAVLADLDSAHTLVRAELDARR